MTQYKRITVDGLLNSGKSELVKLLASEFDAKIVTDNHDNPFYEQYISGISRGDDDLALKTQLIFLLNRYSQQLELSQKGLFYKTTITNYIFERDGIYAHAILKNDDELNIYKKIYSHFLKSVLKPDLVIYLQISFAEMLRRIDHSGPDYIRDVPNEYWRDIFEAFNYFFFNYKDAPMIVINVESVDFNNRNDLLSLINEIKTHKNGVRYYAPA